MPDLQDNIKIITALAIQEDLGTGDITSDLTIDPKQKSKGKIIAKEDGVVSGLAVVEYILNNYTSLTYKFKKHDGDKVVDKEVVVHLSGSTIEILSYERTMLNFLQHLSGIATATSKFVEKAEPFGCKILDTRKTLPGLRKLEKKAVVDGGGMNHRMGLHDAVLIKENHIRAAGSISSAIKKICVSPRFIDLKKKKGFFILVETETLKEVEEACQSGVNGILLDNMPIPLLEKSIKTIRKLAPNIFIEVSGNVTLKTIKQIAETKPDRISIGAITHSAPALDFSLLLSGIN